MSEEKKKVLDLGSEPMGEENISAEELEKMFEAVRRAFELQFGLSGVSEKDMREFSELLIFIAFLQEPFSEENLRMVEKALKRLGFSEEEIEDIFRYYLSKTQKSSSEDG